MKCTADDDCPNPARRGGHCWGHIKRRQRQRTVSGKLRGWGRPKTRVLTEAAIAYADAVSPEEFARAKARLRMASLRTREQSPHSG